MPDINSSELEHILGTALADESRMLGSEATCTALQAHVSLDGGPVFEYAGGLTALDGCGAPVTHSTPFDLASLTKPLVTGTLLMQAVDAGDLAWDDPLGAHLPEWPHDDSPPGQITLLQLLNHTSGLPDWRPFWREWGVPATVASAERARRALVGRIAEVPLEAAPGAAETYSDLGYMLLAAVLESLHGQRLDRVASSRIFEPLEMNSTRFVPIETPDRPLKEAPATEIDPERAEIRTDIHDIHDIDDRMVRGTVHDRNCEALGGVSGHAGAFGTARDLARFAHHLLAVDSGDPPADPLVSRESLRFCWSAASGGPGHHLGCWDTPSGQRSTAGRGLAAGRTVGHLGFTGTSLWIERDRRLVAILLTNRTYPDRENDRINPLRRAFYEAIVGPPRS